jgi:DNA-binding NarL/FixJ family response regulator
MPENGPFEGLALSKNFALGNFWSILGTMEYRLLLVEDDQLMRLSLEAALREIGFDVAVSAGNAAEALRQAKSIKLDAAIIDLHLGTGPNGIDLGNAMRQLNPQLGITFLTSYDDPRLLDSSIQKIPIGSKYITKREISSIQELSEVVISSILNPRLDSAPKTSPISQLTSIQIETLKLVAMGLTNSEISSRRFITQKSVELTISRVAKSLGIPHDGSKNQRVLVAKAFFDSIGGNSPIEIK